MLTFIDIETIPSQKDEVFESILKDTKENFKAPSSLTKTQAAADLEIIDPKEIKFTAASEMISRWENKFKESKAAEVAEEKWRKTALNGTLGEIVSIAWAVEDSKVCSLIRNIESSERTLLTEFKEALMDSINDASHNAPGRKPFFCAHYAVFDLRFLFQRCVINNVYTPFSFNQNGRHRQHFFCTQTEWAGFKDYASLDSIAKALGIQGKTEGMDGSLVWPAIKNGEYKKVQSYNEDDVELLRNIYNRMVFKEDHCNGDYAA